MLNTYNWGIIGLGKIARTFATDLALVPQARLVAVASRTAAKARDFAMDFNVANAYASYAELLANSEVQVVYIATPHTEHFQHSLAALRAGKHVLCEKPLGINKQEVQELIQAASENGVFLMEALWSRFIPALQEVSRIITSGQIGELSYMKADFAFPGLDRDPKGRLLNPDLAGGSLLDIGIYPLFLAYWLLGTPDSFLATAKFHHTGIEKQIGMILEYPNAMAMLYSGLTSLSEMRVELSCTRGNLYILPRWHETDGFEIAVDGAIQTVMKPTLGKGYTHEVLEVHNCLQLGKLESEQWGHADSMALHSLLDAIRERCGIRFPSENGN
ncbi:MAG: hypothetical protein RLZZ241_354 [Bacteroidota bacterium]|jgi:predicted dehydrogenase